MEQTINYKLKIDYLISNNTSLNQETQITPKLEYNKCKECNQTRRKFNEIHQICHVCYKARTFIQSGNEVVDDFIRFTQTNRATFYGDMEFVPYDRFNNLEFIAEGGFSKVYKATWIDGPITSWNEKRQRYDRSGSMVVALKKLNNSKNIGSKELNEV